jgi:hypothetical protein
MSEILLFLDEKIPTIKESVTRVKGDVSIHGFPWVNTMEYALAIRVLKLKKILSP